MKGKDTKKTVVNAVHLQQLLFSALEKAENRA